MGVGPEAFRLSHLTPNPYCIYMCRFVVACTGPCPCASWCSRKLLMTMMSPWWVVIRTCGVHLKACLSVLCRRRVSADVVYIFVLRGCYVRGQ